MALNSMTSCDLGWLRTYNRDGGIKCVAEKLGINKSEAVSQILSTESRLVLLLNDEGKNRLKNANEAKTSHLNRLGIVYRRQKHNSCCGVASMAITWDHLHVKNFDKVGSVTFT